VVRVVPGPGFGNVNASGSQFETSVQDESSTVSSAMMDGKIRNFGVIGKAKKKCASGKAGWMWGWLGCRRYEATSSCSTRGQQQTMEQVGDIKPARELPQSAIKTNPGHSHGGMAAARFNELTDKMVQARSATCIVQHRRTIRSRASKWSASAKITVAAPSCATPNPNG